MKLKLFFIALATGLLAGCVTAPPQNTPSGRNEVTIMAAKPAVKAALVNQMVNEHLTPIADSDYLLVVQGDAGAWADFWFTTGGGRRPSARIEFTLVESNGRTRVIARPTLITPGAFGGYVENEYTNPEVYAQLQWELDCLKAQLQGESIPEKPIYRPAPARNPHSGK